MALLPRAGSTAAPWMIREGALQCLWETEGGASRPPTPAGIPGPSKGWRIGDPGREQDGLSHSQRGWSWDSRPACLLNPGYPPQPYKPFTGQH